MEKMKWKIKTTGSHDIFEYYGTAKGAKMHASKKFLSFGNDVSIESEKGHVFIRKFKQGLNHHWHAEWL